MTQLGSGKIRSSGAAATALALRDALAPLPGREDGYRATMLLGTTGAGKTTLVRQLLGTDPKTERFPSTSTAKTTVAETEIVVGPFVDFRAVITFTPEAEVERHLTENVEAAAAAVLEGRDDVEVMSRLLDHIDQRFRFSYLFGSARALMAASGDVPADDLLDDFLDDEEEGEEEDGLEVTDPSSLRRASWMVAACVRGLRREAEAVQRAAQEGALTSIVNVEDIERDLEVLRSSELIPMVTAELLQEVKRRFTLLSEGSVEWGEDGWPLAWSWTTGSRRDFLRTITRFSGNHAKAFGSLLTPLVNGIRVFAPFKPTWASTQPRLVLIDGEGLGHVAGSSAALSDFTTSRLDEVDTVLLVDSAAQPMQAAPVAAMKAITLAGHGRELLFAFTHFDQVKGDNLLTLHAREEHVLASGENALHSIQEDLGVAGERQMRAQLTDHHYMLAGLHGKIDVSKKLGKFTVDQLQDLLRALTEATGGDTGAASFQSLPVYGREQIEVEVLDATESFHSQWEARLGFRYDPDAPKEHWARVKALTRRAAVGEEEYRHLRPAGELRFELHARLYRMLQAPLEWVGLPLERENLDEFLEVTTNRLTSKLILLTRERIIDACEDSWVSAYSVSGQGSTVVRANIMMDEIFEAAAPRTYDQPTGRELELSHAVEQVLAEVASEMGFVLR